MEAVILAGGKGTRLQPYTDDLPKALVPIGDTPVIEILLRQLAGSGVTRVRVAVGHMADQIKAALGDGNKFGLDLEYSVEPEPLSTVAPIKLLESLPDNFLVANADILTDLDPAALYRAHTDSEALVTVACRKRNEQIDYGVLEIDDQNWLTGFVEKPTYRFAVSMGIYVFSRQVLDYVPEGTPFGFDDLMRELVKNRAPVQAFPYDGYWLDIGRPSDYRRARKDIEIIRGWLK